ncbi:hypothetical protein [Caryophanon latum]|uniref:Uncharacterized protein n=1 Tax=Caryophanon latum TaxID=33977 RepID=A0A1C0YV92_9BACL|nr:hypothetical protein [Caryophanon latum]OCS91081.1 hypothetical protein A6K76_10070 [Caryophanon latum]
MKIHGNSVASNFVNTSVLQKGARIGNGGEAATLSQSTLQLKAPNDVLKNFTNDLTRLKLTMQHSNDYETASKAVDVLDFDQFQAFRESNKQMMETSQKEQDAYSLLIQKLASFKQSIIQ